MKRILVTAVALVAGTAALAQTPPPAPVAPPAPPMAQPTHDRVTSRAEAVEKVREHFSRMDADKDGVITTQELNDSHAGFAERFKNVDGHQDLRMGRGHRDPNAAFDRLDSNKDGAISREEFAQAREERIERRVVKREERKAGARDGKQSRRHAMRLHGGRGFGGRMIVMADADNDGRITLAEAEALALQHFDRLDANRDGQLTPEERRAGRPMIHKQMIEEKRTAG